MSVEQELLVAGFQRDPEITELNQGNEYAVSVSDDYPVVRLSPSDLLNGWWHSKLDCGRKSFDFVRVPIGLSWITRELQRIASRDSPFQWWSKPAAGFYKCHPWARDAYSRIYASNFVPMTTVTKEHESYPTSLQNYLSTYPFGIRGTDPRPVKGAVDAAAGSDETVVQLIEKKMEEAPSLMQKELLKQAYMMGRLNIQEDVDRMARAEAARRADAMFPTATWQGDDSDEEDVPVRTTKRRPRQKKEKPKLDPLLATGRKFDL